MSHIVFRQNHYLDSSFCHLDSILVSTILNHIIDEFEERLSSTFQSHIVYVYNRTDHPMCSFVKNVFYIGLQIPKGNEYLNLIFQFSQEYCHRIIFGGMSRDYNGLKWLEESICEASSIYFLNYFSQPRWQHVLPPQVILPSRTLHDYWIRQGIELTPQLRSYLPILFESKEHRTYYQNIGAIIVHLFLSNPNLWKILLHIGDSCKWNSLEELFVHLESLSDDNYKESLYQLKSLFLP